MSKEGLNVSAERPKTNSEDLRTISTRENLRCENVQNRQNDNQPNHNDYDMVTGENESPIDVPEFLTVRMPSRNHLHRSHDDLNPQRRFGKNMAADVSAKNMPKRLRLKKFAETSRMIYCGA